MNELNRTMQLLENMLNSKLSLVSLETENCIDRLKSDISIYCNEMRKCKVFDIVEFSKEIYLFNKKIDEMSEDLKHLIFENSLMFSDYFQ